MAIYTIDISKKNFRTVFSNMTPLLNDQKLIIVQEKFKGLKANIKFLVESTLMEMRTYQDITSVIHLMTLDDFTGENGNTGTCEVVVNEDDSTVTITKNIKNENNPNDSELNVLSFFTVNAKGFNVLEKNPFITDSNSSIPLRSLNGFTDIDMLTDLNSGIFSISEVKFNVKELNKGLMNETYRYRLVNNYFNEAVFIYYTDKTGEMIGFTSVLDSQEDVIENLKESSPEIVNDPSFKVLLIGTKNEWIKKANDIGLVLSDNKSIGGHFLERYTGSQRFNNNELTSDPTTTVKHVADEEPATEEAPQTAPTPAVEEKHEEAPVTTQPEVTPTVTEPAHTEEQPQPTATETAVETPKAETTPEVAHTEGNPSPVSQPVAEEKHEEAPVAAQPEVTPAVTEPAHTEEQPQPTATETAAPAVEEKHEEAAPATETVPSPTPSYTTSDEDSDPESHLPYEIDDEDNRSVSDLMADMEEHNSPQPISL